jgi:hypothetical protein
MTPELKIKREILLSAAKDDPEQRAVPLDTEGAVRAAWDNLVDLDIHWDYMSDFRSGGVETNLPCAWNRNYESKSVACKLSDGSWVGWTYWYGGGKHGEPEAIDWMQDAYDLECTEEEKLVVVRTFKKRGTP